VLNAFDRLPGVALVPMPVEGFSHEPELDDEVAGQVLRLGLPPFLAPEADQGGFIVAHDDASVGSAHETSAIEPLQRNWCAAEGAGHDSFQFS
jgi:hypothetical protein